MKKLTALIAIAGFAAVMSLNAEAGTASDVATETVRYAKLNAATPQDVATLYRRIDAAAGKVCGQRIRSDMPFVSSAWQRCVQHALRDAVAEIDSPAVTAYAAAKGVVGYGPTIASR